TGATATAVTPVGGSGSGARAAQAERRTTSASRLDGIGMVAPSSPTCGSTAIAPIGGGDIAGDVKTLGHMVRVLLVTGLVLLGAASGASAGDPRFRFASRPMRVWATPADASALPGATSAAAVRTIPTFEDSFVFQGQTFTYDMVGTNPRSSSARTVVPV